MLRNLIISTCVVQTLTLSVNLGSNPFQASPYNGIQNIRSPRVRRSQPTFKMAVEGQNSQSKSPSRNIIGTDLRCCCDNVRSSGIGTGFFRDGLCSTGPADSSRHTVCVRATDEFLTFSKLMGNDLSTPAQQYMFPGLEAGDRWCVCAARWVQACEAGFAPPIFALATHEKTLSFINLETLLHYAIDVGEAEEELKILEEKRMILERSFMDGIPPRQNGESWRFLRRCWRIWPLLHF